MTYVIFLLVFLVLPIAVLSIKARSHWTKNHTDATAIICCLAFIYTSPWDNHAAAQGLWSYSPKLVPQSHFILSLPMEEYLFYLLQGIFIALIVTILKPKIMRS